MIKKYAWVIWISYKCTVWSTFGPLLCLKFANTLFTRICREFEKWCNLHVLSGKFLRQQSCYPESFRFFWLCPQPPWSVPGPPKCFQWSQAQCGLPRTWWWPSIWAQDFGCWSCLVVQCAWVELSLFSGSGWGLCRTSARVLLHQHRQWTFENLCVKTSAHHSDVRNTQMKLPFSLISN